MERLCLTNSSLCWGKSTEMCFSADISRQAAVAASAAPSVIATTSVSVTQTHQPDGDKRKEGRQEGWKVS